jgi:hypothetical protein
LFEIEAAAELLGERTHQAQTLPGRDRRIEAFGQSHPVVRNFDDEAAVRTFARGNLDLACNARGMGVLSAFVIASPTRSPMATPCFGDVM